MTLVAILTVRRDAIERFRAFEIHAAQVMKKHGGRIERTVIVPLEGSPDMLKEVHVITFPSDQAFAAYRNDERLSQLAGLRDQSIVHTELLVGEDGPIYAAG